MTSMTPLARLEENDHAARKRLPSSTLEMISKGRWDDRDVPKKV